MAIVGLDVGHVRGPSWSRMTRTGCAGGDEGGRPRGEVLGSFTLRPVTHQAAFIGDRRRLLPQEEEESVEEVAQHSGAAGVP
jgi:hypothetical protein